MLIKVKVSVHDVGTYAFIIVTIMELPEGSPALQFVSSSNLPQNLMCIPNVLFIFHYWIQSVSYEDPNRERGKRILISAH